MNEAVTFLIPVYNGLPFLHEAIASVLGQTEANWRLLLVDDGSTDGSREALTEYAEGRISVRHNPKNVGLYASLAAALQFVETEWVSILMQDDRIKPFYLAEMLQLIDQYPDVPAIWATEDIIGMEGRLRRKGKDTFRLERIEPIPQSWLSVLRVGCFWTISGSLTRTDFLRALPFRADLPHCGDYEWLLRAIRISPFLYYERSLAELREHAGQASAANLASGRNARESYAILADNFRRHASDATFSQVASICLRRLGLTLRQGLGATAHCRAKAVSHLAKCFVQFAWLPFTYRREIGGASHE